MATEGGEADSLVTGWQKKGWLMDDFERKDVGIHPWLATFSIGYVERW